MQMNDTVTLGGTFQADCGPYLWVEQVGVYHGPFDVKQVSVVLQSSL